ncbi:MAG: nucleoside triphosphate pyrophosphohydrolase family protein [Richelia sp. RM2_1_2]|nr:nucleoside triphosphate pyrophosphohydrolase family protein [Richelia sp. SM1_7_0]NJN06586.1 nucleoside triphosphate pyrophosphohydrolase family protein [Richelia sp. RM1_1_1]NJO30073.1 nucleoside triphosphate pyrophosphohydrolase family protein [Richelia sp. SL_2_1]NJO58408.1 nucleoside triphosphate pyrophosphohydrolase family protein [Richelia sp. RM2_1_2]
MDFREYQEKALISDQVPKGTENGIVVPLLGLVGEAGSLLTEYKKYLRDGDSHKLFKACVEEELGDLLWYVANVASKFDLDLEKIADNNLEKCRDRWGCKDLQIEAKATGYNFDREFPKHERLPRQFAVEITEVNQDNSVKMKAFIDGEQIGNDLTDNSYFTDGYRFHDIFHLSYAAILGWSPVLRSNLKCNEVKRKRKSNPRVDEVEDGGRAIAIEEGISALVFAYAKDHNFLEGLPAVDYQLLKTIKNMTSHLEVSQCSLNDWQKAILMGYDVWRQVNKNRGGMIFIDLDGRSITYQIGGRHQK